MAGTTAGALRAADENRRRYDNDFYVRIGSAGGRIGRTGGFFGRPDLARAAGAIGGLMSRRSRSLSDSQRQRIRHDKKFRQAYKHLLEVQRKAKLERDKLRETRR